MTRRDHDPNTILVPQTHMVVAVANLVAGGGISVANAQRKYMYSGRGEEFDVACKHFIGS
jgi:hypothetical protein